MSYHKKPSSPAGLATLCIHAGQPPDPATGATIVPIYQTSTFTQEAIGRHKGFEYSRTDNPTRRALEQALAAVEGCRYGLAFASGSAATAAVLHLLQPGHRLAATSDLYGGTVRLLETVFRPLGIETVYFDGGDLEGLGKILRGGVKMVWTESPSNPLLQVYDLAAMAELAHHAGSILVVDNTFASPALQRPVLFGADIVVHSTTKYLGGHSDVIGGAVLLKDEKLYLPLKHLQNAEGAVPGPFDCWLVLRGLKTLPLRMKKHSENALKLAQALQSQPKIEAVIYPGLPDHPGHALATRQMQDFGGMLSIRIKGGRMAVDRFLSRLKIFQLAESLGGVESLVCHPATMTHASVPEEIRLRRGIDDGLLRLSVGIEDEKDLLADVLSALDY
jgi:cystathionine gamma-lyase